VVETSAWVSLSETLIVVWVDNWRCRPRRLDLAARCPLPKRVVVTPNLGLQINRPVLTPHKEAQALHVATLDPVVQAKIPMVE
jgi:hypothetical protein